MPQKKKHPGGRPRKVLKVDPQQVEDMAAIGLTRDEIAQLAGVSNVTLWKRLGEDDKLLNAMKRGRHRFTASIRRTIYDEAVNKRNTTAMIWISKNELGWKDQGHMQIGGEKGAPVEVGLSESMVDNIKRLILGIEPDDK